MIRVSTHLSHYLKTEKDSSVRLTRRHVIIRNHDLHKIFFQGSYTHRDRMQTDGLIGYMDTSQVSKITAMDSTVIPIEAHPGYSWHWVAPVGEWVLKWRPVPDRYSPPVFNTGLRWYHIRLPSTMKSPSVLRLHHLRRSFRLSYIVYRPDIQRIEIWSRDLEHAVLKVNDYLRSIVDDKTTDDGKPRRLMPPLPQTRKT